MITPLSGLSNVLPVMTFINNLVGSPVELYVSVLVSFPDRNKVVYFFGVLPQEIGGTNHYEQHYEFCLVEPYVERHLLTEDHETNFPDPQEDLYRDQEENHDRSCQFNVSKLHLIIMKCHGRVI